MAHLKDLDIDWLTEHFPGRVSTDLMERKIYSHDVGEMPPLIKPLIGNAVADAVVQPKDEAEVIALIQWARQNGIPLTPRAKATSGYGGVLPIHGGIIATTWHMRRLLAIDKEKLTATVEPGMVWEDLERALAKQGLALRLYPSSAPSSTVGGWLAQGGFGFGSYQFDAFRANVLSARLVRPDGQVAEVSGNDLDLVSDMEGITGFITQVTLQVRPAEDQIIIGAQFANSRQLADAIRGIAKQGLPIWSISFINPAMARLKNQLPPKIEQNRPASEPRPPVPEAYVATFVYPAPKSRDVTQSLANLITASGGDLLPDEITDGEWNDRFKIMQVKRLGPSLIPAELVIPLSQVDAALEDIESSIHQPIVIEGMIARGERDPQAVLLGFIPHDERRLTFNLAFGLSLSALQKAKQHGGRAYASGLYFADEAESILGAERLQRVRDDKAEHDPTGIMNPGKILGNGLLGSFMSAAASVEPVVRLVGNEAGAPIGERIDGAGRRGIPDDIAWYSHTCAQCGYCVAECDQFYGRGWESDSPRGRWFFLREYMAGRAEMTQSWVEKFVACTTCEMCNVKCPLELPNEPSWLEMRGELVQQDGRLTLPAFEIMRSAVRKERDIWACYSRDRAKWVPDAFVERVGKPARLGYFAGCTASYIENDVAQGAVHLLDKAGLDFTLLGENEACCGLPMLVAGLWDTFEEILRHNMAKMKELGVETVVTSCPACWLSWTLYYREWADKLGLDFPFQVRHISQVIADSVKSGDIVFTEQVPMKVTWHDPCHMSRAGGIFEPPREIIQAIPGIEFVEMEHNREQAHCCGGVITLVDNPDVGEVIGDVRVSEAEATGAQAIITSCPCCEVQLRLTIEKTGRNLPVIDLAHLAARGLGISLPDPTSYALGAWKPFEAMIWLLRPNAMAGLIKELFPQMVDAMPMNMGGFMRAMGRMGPAGGAILSAMKPLFPFLFQRLMPGMMPQIMPAMIDAVEEQVPMPGFMKEQMPDLMPDAMGRLMPKMLPQVVPLISDDLIAYLRRERAEP